MEWSPVHLALQLKNACFINSNLSFREFLWLTFTVSNWHTSPTLPKATPAPAAVPAITAPTLLSSISSTVQRKAKSQLDKSRRGSSAANRICICYPSKHSCIFRITLGHLCCVLLCPCLSHLSAHGMGNKGAGRCLWHMKQRSGINSFLRAEG